MGSFWRAGRLILCRLLAAMSLTRSTDKARGGSGSSDPLPPRCITDYSVAGLVIVNRIDLALRTVPEQHILGQPLQGELARRHQEALEHRLERVELLGAPPHALFDLLRRKLRWHKHAAEVVGVHVGVRDDDAAFLLELGAHRRTLARRDRVEERLGRLDLVKEGEGLVEDLRLVLLQPEEEIE